MIEGKFVTNPHDFTIVKNLRKQVFVDELMYSKDYIIDDLDDFAIQVLAFDKEVPIGTGRIYYDFETDKYIISKLCVLEPYRRKAYADFIVRILLDRAISSNASFVYVDTPNTYSSLFEKIGFERENDLAEKDALITMKFDTKKSLQCNSHCNNSTK